MRPETRGDLIKNMESSQDKVYIMKLGLQHMYLDVIFDSIEKSKQNPERETKGTGS